MQIDKSSKHSPIVHTSHDDNTAMNELVNGNPLHDTMTSLTSIEEIPVRRNGQRFESPEQKAMIQALFLEEFSKQANVTQACNTAGISRETAYRWLREDIAFSDQWQVAEQKANDVLRSEAHRRGVEGYQEPIVSMGKLVYGPDGNPLHVTKYSDTLLLTLMRARMPEYRDTRTQDINMRSTVDIHTSHQLTLDTRSMNAEELATLRSIAEGIQAREQKRLEAGNTGKDNKVIDAGE